jgi:hypothetical protein
MVSWNELVQQRRYRLIAGAGNGHRGRVVALEGTSDYAVRAMARPNTATPIPPTDEADPNEIESAWAKTIERRVSELREGKVEPVPSDEVFSAIDEALESR